MTSQKLYSISKIIFWVVMLLILLLPLGRHWRLLAFGERTTGKVAAYIYHKKTGLLAEDQLVEASEVYFRAGDSIVKVFGPDDYLLEPGKSIRVYYSPRNPSDHVLFNFACLYMTSYSILPLILIFVWWAFYLSYNNYHREKHGESRTPASSPYVPFGKSYRRPKKSSGKPKQIS